MLSAHLRRGAVTGFAGGLCYGVFVAIVGRPLVATAESYESGAVEATVPAAVTAVGSAVAGAVWGLLLGFVVFGIVYYLLEPAIPGEGAATSYLLGGAGFLTVSGVPWIGLPPQPPGVEQALPAGTRVLWYGLFMLVGAVTCGLAGYLYDRLAARTRPIRLLGTAAPFALLATPALSMPPNPVTGPVPAEFVDAYRAIVVLGQVGLWFVMASVHAWLLRRRTPSRLLAEPSTILK